MITPLDIQKKQFSKSLRGLNEKEVQSFLQEVFGTLEKHINDNAELKERLSRSNEEMQKYKNIEKTLSETLVVAKRTAEDLMVNARREAEQLVAQARLQAKAIEEQSKREILELRSQRMMMEKDLEGFRLRMEGLLRAQLDVVSHYKSDVALNSPQPQPQQLHAQHQQLKAAAAPVATVVTEIKAAPAATAAPEVPQAVQTPQMPHAAQSPQATEEPQSPQSSQVPESHGKPSIADFTREQLHLAVEKHLAASSTLSQVRGDQEIGEVLAPKLEF